MSPIDHDDEEGIFSDKLLARIIITIVGTGLLAWAAVVWQGVSEVSKTLAEIRIENAKQDGVINELNSRMKVEVEQLHKEIEQLQRDKH